MNFKPTIVVEFGPKTLALGDRILSTLADFNTKLDALQSSVDAVKAEIAAGGLTASEEATVLARLDTLQANLTAAE